MLSPTPDRYAETARDGAPVLYAVYEIARHVSTQRVLNLDAKHTHAFSPTAPIAPPVLIATQFQTGTPILLYKLQSFSINSNPSL